MRIIFVTGATDKDDRLYDAMAEGIRSQGDQTDRISSTDFGPQRLDCDFVALNGLRRMDWLEYCRDNAQPFLYFDKGYRRVEKGREWFWRVGVNETHQTEYVRTARHTSERVTKLQEAMGLPEQIPEWRSSISMVRQVGTAPVIIASSSEKFHHLHGLLPPRQWVPDIIRQIRQHTHRPILYRPKPSWGDPGPIDGSECVFDIKHMSRLFAACHALITYGSYICVDAMLEGVPSIVLGNGVIRHLSSTDLSEIETPKQASREERMQAMANLAWCQYTRDEWADGYAWKNTKRLFIEK